MGESSWPEEDVIDYLVHLRDRAIAVEIGIDDDDRKKAIGVINAFLAKWGIPPKGPTA
jgi:hypothetical protein